MPSSTTANSTKNATITRSSISSFPAFLRPSVNPSPECDIWGPLCQTGTIVVAVNLTSTTTITTVPCSYYLSAQSSSVESASEASHARGPLDYRSSFGRSPQCTSYQKAYLDNAAYPLSNCPKNDSGALLPAYNYFPAGSGGVVGGHATDFFYCCGNCTMFIDQVKVLYFPEDGGNGCAKGNGTAPAQANATAPITKRVENLANSGDGLATYNGYTL